MSPDLSHRIGAAFHFTPASGLRLNARVRFLNRNDAAESLEDLDEEDQRLVLESEMNMGR